MITWKDNTAYIGIIAVIYSTLIKKQPPHYSIIIDLSGYCRGIHK